MGVIHKTCPHCGTASKLHPVSAAACEQYENGPTPEQVKVLVQAAQAVRYYIDRNKNYRGWPVSEKTFTSPYQSLLDANEKARKVLRELADTCTCGHFRYRHRGGCRHCQCNEFQPFMNELNDYHTEIRALLSEVRNLKSELAEKDRRIAELEAEVDRVRTHLERGVIVP